MNYTVRLVKKRQQYTAYWSGGTTTQLAIYPEQAEYGKRNFFWRLSTAQVDLEESTFTLLPDVSRILMVLEGEIRLEHQNHHTTNVKPYEQDMFQGDWTTRCLGKATDLNLMMKAGCEGKLTAYSMEGQSQFTVTDGVTVNGREWTTAFYCIEGNYGIILGTESYLLEAGDVLLIYRHTLQAGLDFTLKNSGTGMVHIVRADMYHPEIA